MLDFQHRSKHHLRKTLSSLAKSDSNHQHQHTDSTTMPAPSSILVLGAGELGNEVLQSLASHPSRGNCQISLLIRESTLSNPSPTKQAELQILHGDAQISFVTGDIANDSIQQLTATLAPFDTVISCTGMALPPGSQLKLTRAIFAARVRRTCSTSSLMCASCCGVKRRRSG
jgi:glutamyl-tRNA reductase